MVMIQGASSGVCNRNETLIELMQLSNPIIKDDAFDPVLYTLLKALQGYIACYESRKVQEAEHVTNGTHSSVVAAAAQVQTASKVAHQQPSTLSGGNVSPTTPTPPNTAQKPNKISVSSGKNPPSQQSTTLPRKSSSPSAASAATTAPTSTPNITSHASSPSSTITTPKSLHTKSTLPASVRHEQQKKIASERRRKDVALQRKLQRAQQKLVDIGRKREFLATDLRKKELVVQAAAARPHQRAPLAHDTAAQVQQIRQQMATVDKEMQQQHMDIAAIQAEMEQPKSEVVQSTVWETKITEERRAAELAAKRLEEEKRAAEKRRQKELESQRQRAREALKLEKGEKERKFLDQHRRKQELMANAKVAKTGLNDTVLLKKLNREMTELEEDVGQKTTEGNEKAEKGLKEDEHTQPSEMSNTSDSTLPALEHKRVASGSPSPNGSKLPQGRSGSSTDLNDCSSAPPLPNGNDHDASRSANASTRSSPSPLPQSNHQHHQSGSDRKYMQMVQPTGDDPGDDAEESSRRQIALKRHILTQWGLQPPHMQYLRPIYDLLCTIQNAYPSHSHFERWKPITTADLGTSVVPTSAASFDEKKLSKAVRKLRFFLHTDKLPRDLADDHRFVCKLLWDITNDAWEDYKKAKEEMDWIH